MSITEQREMQELRATDAAGQPAVAAPVCPHFGVCGGCRYLDKSYEEQLALKEKEVRNLLQGAFEEAKRYVDADACDSAEIVNGQKLVFEKGVNQDFGITSRDNSMLDGEYEIHVSTFTTRNGQKSRYFVDRYDMENPSDSPRDRRLEILNKVLVPAVEEKLPHDLKATAFKVAASGEEDAF